MNLASSQDAINIEKSTYFIQAADNGKWGLKNSCIHSCYIYMPKKVKYLEINLKKSSKISTPPPKSLNLKQPK